MYRKMLLILMHIFENITIIRIFSNRILRPSQNKNSQSTYSEYAISSSSNALGYRFPPPRSRQPSTDTIISNGVSAATTI